MRELPARVTIDPDTLQNSYGLLGALVTPRPIAWVSTRSPDGVDNLAPHSFFQVVSVAPPIILISTMGEKDTVRNARASGEFVVSGTPVPLIEQVNITAVEFDPSISEFDAAGLTREPSQKVAPFRVAEAPYAMECKVHDIQEIGNGVVLLGEVVLFAINENLMNGKHVKLDELNLAARLTGAEWAKPGEIVIEPRYGVEEYQQRYPAGFPVP